MGKLYILSLICILLPVSLSGKPELNYQEALRIDFVLTGNHMEQKATIVNYLKTPNFHSSSSQSIPDFDYGAYRILVLDSLQKDTLFLKGFCTLFEEWQTTNEAKIKDRAFKQTIEVPFPVKPVFIKIEARNTNWDFTPLIAEKFSPEKLITKIIPKGSPTIMLHGVDDPTRQLDILILAEGYTSNEAGDFFKDAQRITKEIFETPPYNQLKEKITIRAMAVSSEDSGTDDPRADEWKNTAMNSSFNTFETDRYLESLSTWKIYDFAAAQPRDHIIVLVNTKKYGGGGVYNHFSISSADHPQAGKVLIHEMGHGLAGLADEYYSSDVSYSFFFDMDAEPWNPNITTLINFESKWKNLIHDTIPVPTPAENKYKKVTGLFEGAGYSAKGIFRPSFNCRMKANEADGFCAVCKQSIEKMVNFYTK